MNPVRKKLNDWQKRGIGITGPPAYEFLKKSSLVCEKNAQV
jgi:hypothetical protein